MTVPGSTDTERGGGGRARERMVEIRFLVPELWRDAVARLAHSQRITIADVMRIMLRGFMRERFTPEQQRDLGIDT